MGLKEWLEDEYDDGMEAGIVEGERKKLASQVEKKLAKGNTPEEIADILEEDLAVILEIIKEINKE